ncbi:hypothetical protein QQF64_005265 [Cirrhinus molitorella]|uniref:Uncharacterized protein n=1 Tax=Cirrhinus molitorella TaxID=172907 RepID=A0ABR3MJT3_9TELE
MRTNTHSITLIVKALKRLMMRSYWTTSDQTTRDLRPNAALCCSNRTAHIRPTGVSSCLLIRFTDTNTNMKHLTHLKLTANDQKGTSSIKNCNRDINQV